jgi:hypothetical protein
MQQSQFSFGSAQGFGAFGGGSAVAPAQAVEPPKPQSILAQPTSVSVPVAARAGTGVDSQTTRRRRNRDFARKTDATPAEREKGAMTKDSSFVTVFGLVAEKSPSALRDRSLTHVFKGTRVTHKRMARAAHAHDLFNNNNKKKKKNTQDRFNMRRVALAGSMPCWGWVSPSRR